MNFVDSLDGTDSEGNPQKEHFQYQPSMKFPKTAENQSNLRAKKN